MTLPDYSFTEGFDKYGPVGCNISAASQVAGEWTSVTVGANGFNVLATPLIGSGGSLRMYGMGGGAHPFFIKNLPGSYARAVGGFCFNPSLNNGPSGITLGDTGSSQLSIGIDGTGFIKVYRGWWDGTVIATAVQSVSANSTHWIEYDITIHNTTGIIKVWLDGVITSLNLTGQNTRSTSNNSYNQLFLSGRAGSGFLTDSTFDHVYLWCYTSSGGSETPALTNPIVETQFGTSDDTTGWTVGSHVIQNRYYYNSTTDAPGANQLAIRQFIADASGNIDSIRLDPNATSAGAKFKSVVYADSSGSPASLLATGTEVVGCTSGTALILPLSSPLAVTQGTVYWVGYITDTSVSMKCNSSTGAGYKKANTYTSGPPSPAGVGFSTTNSNWNFLAVMSGVTTHYTQVDENACVDDLSYNYSSTISQQELYNFGSLSVTPTAIYSVAVKARVAKVDSGVRTLDLQTKSSSTTSAGSNAGQAPSLTYGFISSYYNVDPATSVAWTGSGVNAAKHGIKVAS